MPKSSEHMRSRPPMERMLYIHNLLQKAEYPNCSKIAATFEIATRTAKRDVDFMKERLGLPIEYDDRRWGFYYTKPVEHFPLATVTEAELFALLVAHKAIAQYHGTSFQAPLEAAFRKLTGQLDRDERFTMGNLSDVVSFRPFAPEDTDIDGFQTITRALQERRALKFTYRKLGAKTAERRLVHPYHLACIENHWYLFAHDVKRNAIRTFVLTRLRRPELTDTRFTVPKDFNATEYLRGSFSAFKGHEDYEVVIDFDAWSADLIRGRKWHATQEITELPSGELRLRLRLDSLEEAEPWVLRWGTHATVVRPKALTQRLRETGERFVERYGEKSESGK